MAELADAADSKSAGTWYLGGSIPPPGTSLIVLHPDSLSVCFFRNRFFLFLLLSMLTILVICDYESRET